MKFQPEFEAGVNMIGRHDPGRVVVGALSHAASVIVPWVGEVLAWPPRGFDELRIEHFEQLAALGPDLVIVGSGQRMRFVPARLLRPLIERRIGVECMDTAAACRTYNVLVTEKRSVAAALIIEPASR